MSFASFVGKLTDALTDGIRTVQKSRVIPNTVGKATRIGLNVGKAAGNVGFKVGMGAVNTTLDGANFIKDHHKAIGRGLKSMGKGALLEANEWAQAGAGVLQKMDDWFLSPTNLDRSLIGRKFNKRGLALFAVGAGVVGSGKAATQYVRDRQGQNDGQLYKPTPQMSTPYMLSQQMAYSQHGRSFADNAGATGDLVFALNNMRNG